MKKLILYLIISIFIILKNDICYGQFQYGWKKINEISNCIEYLDTLNIKNYNKKIFFYIKEEYPNSDFKKRNICWPDSVYILYCADTINSSIRLLSRVACNSNGTIEISMSEPTEPLGQDLLEYGIFNLMFAKYYYLVTGKSLILKNKK